MLRARTFSEWRSYWTMRVGEWGGMHLPPAIGLRGAEIYRRLTAGPASTSWKVVAANLSRVLGRPADSELVQSATHECLVLYGRYWYDTFALRSMPWQEVNRRFSMTGREHIDSALERGRGVILALPHMGNWDAAGHWIALQGYRMTAVAEVLRPPELSELFVRHRRALGMGIVPLTGGSEVGEKLVRLLAQNEIITLVSDRSLSGRGVEVEMFGAVRKLPAGPALLALATGAALSVSSVFTTDDGWYCQIEAPLEIERTGKMRDDVAAATRLMAQGFERHIAAAPTDWHMLQPAWNDAGSLDAPRAASAVGAVAVPPPHEP